MLVAVSPSTAGFLGFGMSVEQKQLLTWLLLFASLHALSVGFTTQVSLTYVIDCHPKDAKPGIRHHQFRQSRVHFPYNYLCERVVCAGRASRSVRCDHGYQFRGVRADNPGVRIWEEISKRGMNHVSLASLMNHCMLFYNR